MFLVGRVDEPGRVLVGARLIIFGALLSCHLLRLLCSGKICSNYHFKFVNNNIDVDCYKKLFSYKNVDILLNFV